MYYQKNPSHRPVRFSWYTLGLPRTLYITVWISFFIVLLFSGLDLFKSLSLSRFFDAPPMHRLTSVCFLLALTSVIFYRITANKAGKIISVSLPIVLSLLALITLYAEARLLFNADEPSFTSLPGFTLFFAVGNRMALVTAIAFFITGIVLFFLNTGRSGVAHLLNIVVSLIGYYFIIGFLLKVNPSFFDILPVSVDTSISLVSLCILIFTIEPRSWLIRVFVNGYSGGVIARQLLIPLLILPMIIGWLTILGERGGWFTDEVGVVIVALTYTSCFLILIWLALRSINSLDHKRMQSEKSAIRSNERLALLSDVASRLLAAENPQQVVNDLCTNVMQFIDCHVFFNYLAQKGSDRLHLNAFSGVDQSIASSIEWLQYGSAICGCVAATGNPIVSKSVQQNGDERANLVRSFGIRAYACHPLKSHDRVIGTLSFGTRSRDSFSEDDLSLMRIVTDQVAIAMGRIINEQDLRESEDRFRTIAESLPVLISITRISDSTIRFANDAYTSAYGYSKKDMIGKKAIDMYFYPDERNEVVALLAKQGFIENIELKVKRKDDTAFWVMTSVKKITFEGEPSYLSATINIDERKKQQQELVRLNRTLNALGKSSQLIVHSNTENDLLRDVCRIITEDCGYMLVWIGYMRDDEAKSVEPVAFHGLDKNYIEQMHITWADTERGRGPTGTAIRTGKPAVCQNMLTDPFFAPWRDEAVKRGYASSVVLPLISEGRPFGALTIYSREPDSFGDDDIKMLSNLADDLANGIIRFRLMEAERKANAAIKESEEKFRLLFESMIEGFAIGEILVDGHGEPYGWNFISVNPAFEKQTGLIGTDIIGRNIYEVLPDLEKFWLEKYSHVALDGVSEDFENYAAALDAWFRVSAFRVRKGVFACIFENITQRVIAEKELKSTKDYLEKLINYANAPIIVWNKDTEIQVFNHAFEHLTGYTAEEVLGKKLDLLFSPDSASESNRKIKQALTQNWETIELPVLTKDHRIKQVLWNSANIYDTDNKTVLSTIAQGNDVTDRITAEKELRHAMDKLDLALENANIGIWSWQINTNEFEWDDRIGQMICGEKAAVKATYEHFERYIYEEDISHFQKAVKKATDEHTTLDTIFRIRKNGEYSYFEAKGHVDKDEQGRAFKMSGVLIDITSMQKTTDKTLLNLNEDLLRSNKELEQFAYVASHDLQEPLRMVSSFTQLLASRYKDKLDHEAMEFIDFAVDGAQRMQRLINDLLQYSRVKTRAKELDWVNMNTVVSETMKLLSVKIKEKNAQITSERLPVVFADENQMIQLFQNLVENGMKFAEKKPEIKIGCSEEQNYFEFSVTDNGIGIEPQYYDRIFQIFQRLHLRDQYGGTGIGLAICQRIVERHGGKIWVASSNGHGTTFKFTIKKN
ncbi:MAG TPA: PAS domain S-box protein [Bacteroidales bacterium]|nr:PAS domain S-box protein [Bacteroidales bacterium]